MMISSEWTSLLFTQLLAINRSAIGAEKVRTFARAYLLSCVPEAAINMRCLAPCLGYGYWQEFSSHRASAGKGTHACITVKKPFSYGEHTHANDTEDNGCCDK